MQMKHAGPFAIALLTGACGGSWQSSDDGDASCSFNDSTWHFEPPSPPNRVLVWRVVAKPGEFQVNGKTVKESSALAAIGETRAYRPSPYLILSRQGPVGCRDVESLAKKIEKAFDCNTNYCFYAGSDN